MATITTDLAPIEQSALVPVEVIESPTVQTLNERAIALMAEAHGLRITDDASDLVGAELIVRGKAIARDLKKAQTDATTPFEKTKKAIIAWFSAHLAPIDKTVADVESKHKAYKDAKKAAEAKETERLRKLAEKRQEKAIARAEAKGEEPPAMDIPMPSFAAPPKTIKTASGSLTSSTRWTWRPATDEAAMVEALAKAGEYSLLALDRGMVKRRVDSGVRSIPGAEVYEVETFGGRS